MQFTMALALMIGFSSVSFAQEKAQSTLKTEAVHTDGRANKKFTEDTRITDIELKAQAGSLSRFSLKFDLSYSGPPVDDLSDPEMPNPDGRIGNARAAIPN